MRKSKLRAERGFTLIELSIVLVIISLMIAGIVSLQNKKIRAEKMAEVERKMDVIEKALLDFRMANNSLPCPALNTTAITAVGFGVADADATCDNVVVPAGSNIRAGTVPVRTLGLSDEDAIDPWGGRFTYAVHSAAVAANAMIDGVNAFTARDVTGNDNQMIIRNPDDTANVTVGGLVSVISHGPNGYGAFSAIGTQKSNASATDNENRNCFCTGAAPVMLYLREQDSTFFDDIVRYYTDDFFFNYDEKHQF